jgi:thiol:disulfide interchange protein DsbA
MSLRKALAFFTALVALSFGAAAQQQQSYATLSPPQPTESAGKIEVVEFFWYGCPHCYALEPTVNAWLKTKPADVVFKRVPAAPNAGWAQLASVYYTLETMGLLEQYHSKVFDAIHKEGKNLMNDKIRTEWLTKNGIDAAKFDAVQKSFSVDSKVKRAAQLTAAYKVDGVPRIFVNGKYYTAPEFVGQDGIFPTVDKLIAMARKDNGTAAK